jgi:hypothetical protein
MMYQPTLFKGSDVRHFFYDGRSARMPAPFPTHLSHEPLEDGWLAIAKVKRLVASIEICH